MNTKYKSGQDVFSQDWVENYIKGKLKEDDLKKFESAMNDDPFLRDAVEGYRNFPKTFGKIDKIKSRTSAKASGHAPSWKNLLIWSGSAAIVMILSVAVLLNQREETLVQMEEAQERFQEDRKLAREQKEKDLLIGDEDIDSLITQKALLTKDTDTSFQIAIASSGDYKKKNENFLTAKEFKKDSLDEIIKLNYIPIVDDELPEVKLQKTYNTYHIEDYKLYEYGDRNSEKIKQLIPILGGVPASLSDEKSEDPISDLVYEEVPYSEFLREAVIKLSEERFKRSYQMFKQILEYYPDDANARFYSAYCSFVLEKHERAKREFQHSLESEIQVFVEESEFHLALCLYNEGERKRAIDLMRDIAASDGFYRNQAHEFLKKHP